MNEYDEQDQRMLAVIGDEEADPDEALALWHEHLIKSLSLPCDVTGIEDFRWEEPYVLGGRNKAEYERLKKTQPSYEDIFELLSIENDPDPSWMMSHEDLGARVRRKSDKKVFDPGLSELEATDEKSKNHELLDDYVYWFVNHRQTMILRRPTRAWPHAGRATALLVRASSARENQRSSRVWTTRMNSSLSGAMLSPWWTIWTRTTRLSARRRNSMLVLT